MRVLIPAAIGLLILAIRPAREAVTAGTATAFNLVTTGVNTVYSETYNYLRGIRNNNPGNIRHGDNWQGMAPAQTDQDFITFKSPEWGVRAMGKVLVNYEKRHGLNTVRGIVSRWAPSSENNTDAYVQHVAQQMGVNPDQPISVRDHLKPLAAAIIKHENGLNPYPDSIIDAGLAMV